MIDSSNEEDFLLAKTGSIKDIEAKIKELRDLRRPLIKTNLFANHDEVSQLSQRITVLEVCLYSRKYDLTIEEAMAYHTMRKEEIRKTVLGKCN